MVIWMKKYSVTQFTTTSTSIIGSYTAVNTKISTSSPYQTARDFQLYLPWWEHSRFSHCLGVYEIARRITEIFEEKYPKEWDPAESLLTMTAALLHDLGHGAYSHTFEHLFDTDHEAITQEIIQSPETEIHQVLLQVAPDFPEKVASVIDHTYPNKQVVQLISSQIDADRMDYLLRDSYFTGASYGGIWPDSHPSVIRPVENGIAFQRNGMHAIEDYVLSRYQMYMQVYFPQQHTGHGGSPTNLLKRAKELYPEDKDFFARTSPHLLLFWKESYSIWLSGTWWRRDEYLLQLWMTSPDKILADLSQRFVNRKGLLNPLLFQKRPRPTRNHETAGWRNRFDPDYYTAIHKTLTSLMISIVPNLKSTDTDWDSTEKWWTGWTL